MKRTGFTLVELLVALAIIATLFGIACALRLPSRDKATGEPPTTIQMVTVQHDGHWWVLCRQHFAHHPDCPCRGLKSP